MDPSLRDVLAAYDPKRPLDSAFTIPGPWYTDPRVATLERSAVFGRTWQALARTAQLEKPGQFVTAEIAGEPLVAVRGSDGVLRAFFNVCRHHATPVMLEECGLADKLRCGYHGWTYNLQGELRGMTDFEGVKEFDRSRYGLVEVRVETWEHFVFVNLDPQAKPLLDTIGALADLLRRLELSRLQFFERRSYVLACNWKAFVDNYLDGGYHVPHMHKGLNSVLEYSDYTIENGEHYCVQSSPMAQAKAEESVAAVRKGDRAYYLWLHPNFMINCYEGTLDTNLVRPLGIDRCHVTFDFYFTDDSEAARVANHASVEVADKVQGEDVAICEGVQRGLGSRAYGAGRLSLRREAGEHLFHRLLHADLTSELARA